jgi:hypothetical protein
MPETAAPRDGLREQLLELVDGKGAHMPFDEAFAAFPRPP